jgi:hypothetical protein
VLGPADGRHVLREAPEAEPSHVVVLHTLGAPVPRRRLSRRPKPAELEPGAVPEPGEVPLTRASVVFTALGEAEPPADHLLAREALDALNRVVRAHRLAAADPHVHEAAEGEVIAVRVGRATGAQAAEGRLAEGRDLPTDPPRRKRAAMLSPVERTAALLARREEPLACEELVLRVRLDHDAGREREAAIGLRAALSTALAELGDDPALADRVAELRGLEASEDVEHVLGRLEALLRARHARP